MDKIYADDNTNRKIKKKRENYTNPSRSLLGGGAVGC